MRVYLEKTKFYFLTCDTNGDRKKNMVERFGKFDLTEVHPILGIHKLQSGASGFMRMLDLAISNQGRNSIFTPFILLEDDNNIYGSLPDYLDVPDDADLLYIGISKWGILNNHALGQFDKVMFKDIVQYPGIVQIYNMLSTHAIMVCSMSGALAIQKSVMETYFTRMPWDLVLAQIQPFYNVYALKTPLVFQDGMYESSTKFTFDDITRHPYNKNNIHLTSLSVKVSKNNFSV